MDAGRYELLVSSSPTVCSTVTKALDSIIVQKQEAGEEPPCAPEDRDAILDGIMFGMMIIKEAEASEHAADNNMIEPSSDALMRRRAFRTGSGEVVHLTEGTIQALRVLVLDGTLFQAIEAEEDDEDRLIREGEAAFAALSPEQQPTKTRPGDELLERMQEPGAMQAVDKVFRRD